MRRGIIVTAVLGRWRNVIKFRVFVIANEVKQSMKAPEDQDGLLHFVRNDEGSSKYEAQRQAMDRRSFLDNGVLA